MTYDELLEFKTKTPFDPFDLVLIGGARHRITHPELLKIGKDLVAIGIPGEDYEATRIAEHIVSQDLANIERVEPLESTSSN